jgi:hypothetical protein
MADRVPDEPLLVSGPQARRLLNIGPTKYWALVKAGRIETVDLDGRRWVTFASLKRLAQPEKHAA